MIATVLVTIISNVITIFSLFRLFLQDERTLLQYFVSISSMIWNTTRTMTTFIAIYNASKVTFQVNYISNYYILWNKTLKSMLNIVEQRAASCRQQMHVSLQWWQLIWKGKILFSKDSIKKSFFLLHSF